jgi:hypothetical protein
MMKDTNEEYQDGVCVFGWVALVVWCGSIQKRYVTDNYGIVILTTKYVCFFLLSS